VYPHLGAWGGVGNTDLRLRRATETEIGTENLTFHPFSAAYGFEWWLEVWFNGSVKMALLVIMCNYSSNILLFFL
jgi:hypothetical protein